MAQARYYSSTALPTTLTSSLGATGNPQVASITGLPAQTPYTILIDWGTSTQEAISVTSAPTGTGPYTLPCTRGIDGTTAQSHALGASVVHGVSAQDFSQPMAFIGNQTWAGLLTRTTVKTSGYTVTPGDYVPCDTTSGSFTVTLPAAPADLSVFGVKLIISAATVNPVTIAASGGDVFNKTSGSTTETLSTLNQGFYAQYQASSGIWTIYSADLALSQLDARYTGATSSDAYTRTKVQGTPAGVGLRDFISARDAPFNAKFDGTTDDATALNNAQQASAALHMPDGTAIVGTAITWNKSKCHIRGEGMYATTVKSTGGLLGILKQGVTVTGFVSEVEISDLTLDCSGAGSYAIQALGSAISRLTIRRVRFVNCPSAMITGGYAANYVIEDCVGDGAGLGAAGGTFVSMTSLPMESLVIRRNKVRWANQGIQIGSSGFHSAYVEITDNDIDLGWWLIKPAFTGSGGTVTYSAGGLTDSGASFSGIATGTTVRVMPVRQTGTLVSGSAGTYIKDTSATFVTNAVKRGEIVRAGTAFAVVSKVISETALHVEEWLDQTTYQPVAPPALSASYTVYGIILGCVTASTGTTITVSHGSGHGGSNWYDLTGTELTPANGTLYEVLVAHPSYPVYCDTVTDKLQITNNRIRRGWSDGIECFGSKAIITGNIVEDGQDEGIVFQGTSGGVIANNLCKHNGTSGIDIILSSSDLEIGPNLLQDNTWGAPVSNGIGQMVISASTGVTVTGGKAYSLGDASPQYGLVLNGSALSGVKVIGFTGVSSGTADVYVASTVAAAACQLLDITGTIVYQGTTNGQLTRVSGTGVPSLIASPGSQFLRTDGAANSTLYVKETGNGTGGWAAYLSSGGSNPVGSQTVYAKATSSIGPTAVSASTWTQLGTLSITLPNDSLTYRINLTGLCQSASVTGNLEIGVGTAASAGSILAATLINATSSTFAALNVTAQQVTGSGQTINVYGLDTTAGNITLTAGGSTNALIELAAYRVA